MTQLVTGEAVALDLRPAALPSRLVAAVLDGLAQLLVLVVLSLALGAAASRMSSAAAAALSVVMLLLVVAGYPVLFETLWRGRTPGKAAMGLRVVRDDGGPIGFRQALVRGLASLFLERPGITVFTGAVVTSLLNRDSKRLGDLLAGTVVLQERIPSRVLPPVPMPPQLADWATGLDLSGLPDDLAQSVRSFVARSPELTDQAREDLGGRLVAAVQARTSPPPPDGTPGWAYLAAVLAERRRRAELQLAATAAGPTSIAQPAAVPPASGALPQEQGLGEGQQTSTTGGFVLPS
ncbi:MAG: RDD family protein [Mycobacteriales bacterium]